MSDITWKFAKHPDTGKIVPIDEANKLNRSAKYRRDYKCLDCGNLMVVRKGEKRQHHFAHKSDSHRESCQGEGGRHWTVKLVVLDFLNQREIDGLRFFDSILEKRLRTGLQPDVVARYRRTPQARTKEIYIEIVDKNPPSEQKKKEFGRKLLTFTITDLSDQYIAERYFMSDFGLTLQTHIKRRKPRVKRHLGCSAITQTGEKCCAAPIRGTDRCMFHRKKKSGS